MEVKSIIVDVIPHSTQRYNTVGDWYFSLKEGELVIKVSETGNWKWNMCIALHELTEAIACTADGVTQEQVDEFDKSWKPNFGYEEPGEDPRAPYFEEHGFASRIEEESFDFITFGLAVDEWKLYEAKLEELMKSRE